MSKHRERLEQLQQYLAQDPDNLRLLVDISESCGLLGEKEQALHYIRRIRAIDEHAGQHALGVWHLHDGQPQSASIIFNQILKQTDGPETRYNLSFCYFALHQPDKAQEILLPLVENTAQPFPESLFLMAQIEYHRQNLSEAIGFCQRYLASYPQADHALGLLALLYFDQGAHQQAEAFARQALQLNPANSQAQSVNIYLKMHQQQASPSEITSLLQQTPDDGRLYFALGNSQMLTLDFNAALQSLHIACQLLPDFIESWQALGWVQLLLGQHREAEDSFQHMLMLDTHHAEAHGGLAIAAVLNEQWETAEQQISAARRLDENACFFLFAEALMQQNSAPEKARSHFENAIEKMAKVSGLAINPTILRHLSNTPRH
ncbi:MAG: tetratricopeptide repeat protein [Legionellaceae bacterium]|nr:tetratricopeptide repeat protein [Legionellaceae bacterium]